MPRWEILGFVTRLHFRNGRGKPIQLDQLGFDVIICLASRSVKLNDEKTPRAIASLRYIQAYLVYHHHTVKI